MAELKKQAIVGIDPGTNTALVLVDLEGNIIFKNAKKNYSNEEIIKDIVEHSDPVLICTDKANVPGKVKEIAAKLNTRVFYPSRDLTIQEKLELTKYLKFEGKMKEHLIDAAAAALYALSKYRKLIEKTKKIENVLERREVVKLILNNEGLNISAALDIIRKNIKSKDSKGVSRVCKKMDVFARIRKLEEENKRLKETIRALEEELRKANTNATRIIVAPADIDRLHLQIKIKDEIIESVKEALRKDHIILIVGEKAKNRAFAMTVQDYEKFKDVKNLYISKELFEKIRDKIYRIVYVVKKYKTAGPFVIVDPKDIERYEPVDIQKIKSYLKNIIGLYRKL